MSILVLAGVGGCCRKTMARPDNLAQASQSCPSEPVSPKRVSLAQASQSRLGEMERD